MDNLVGLEELDPSGAFRVVGRPSQILIDRRLLVDDAYLALLGVVVESIGIGCWGASVDDTGFHITLNLGGGVGSLEVPRDLRAATALNPGQLRHYRSSSSEWWVARVARAAGWAELLKGWLRLGQAPLSDAVDLLLNEPAGSIAAFTGPRWQLEFLQRLAMARGGRVIPSKEQLAGERAGLVMVEPTDDPLQFLPTWAGLSDLNRNHTIIPVLSERTAPLFADAVISEGLREVVFDRRDIVGAATSVRPGYTLRRRDTSPTTAEVQVPSLAAPANSTVTMLAMAGGRRASEPRVAVWAPPFNPSSGGVSILYRLATELMNRGVCTGVMPIGPRRLYGKLVPDFPDARFLLGADRHSLVHIQPETLNIDVPGSARVIWELYFRGDLPFGGGPIPEAETEPDLVVTHSASLSPNTQRLYMTPVDFELFRPTSSVRRKGILLYVGKSHLHPEFVIPAEYLRLDPLIVHRSWPSRSLLADLFRQSELLISLDPFSSTNTEATLCGCPVLVDTRFARPGARDDLSRFEFGLEGFSFDVPVTDARSEQVDGPGIWERLRTTMSDTERADLDRFVETILPSLT